MGKYLVIKNVDFSDIAIEKVTLVKNLKELAGTKVTGHFINGQMLDITNEQCDLMTFEVNNLQNKTLYITMSGRADRDGLSYNSFFNGDTTMATPLGGHQIINVSDGLVSGTVPLNATNFKITCKLVHTDGSILDVTVKAYYEED